MAFNSGFQILFWVIVQKWHEAWIRPPPQYFYGTDNGLLHLLLMKWFLLGIKRVTTMAEISRFELAGHQKQRVAIKCMEKYKKLDQVLANHSIYSVSFLVKNI